MYTKKYINNLSMNARYEKKFLINFKSFYEVDNLIKINKYNFKKTYSDRFVNNIYFDSNELNNYKDNIEGNTNRKKVRIRWYGNLKGKVIKPKLEIKIKRGEIGYKEVISIGSFNFDKNFSININGFIKELELINKKHIIDNLYATLVNRYRRRYYESFDKKFRITLDEKVEYYPFFNKKISFFKKNKDENSVILEIKYDLDSSKNVDNITNQFPFRLTKSSKYVSGIERIKQYNF